MRLSREKKWLCAATAAAFLFLFLESAPHRVHHFFDQADAAQCLVFSVTQGCHLQPTSAISLPALHIASEEIALSPEVWIAYSTPFPFSQRAPPVA